MNILSLFDGMSCGQIALRKLGIKYNNYFASEIDKYAMQVTKANYPETIHLGNVVNVKGKDLPQIDILIGGSPCQSFSFAGTLKGMTTTCNKDILTLEDYLQLKEDGFEFEGQSYLFWEYIRILREVKPKYFLLENVKMSSWNQKIISQAIGIDPIFINSSLLSAQSRKRLYWTNAGTTRNNLFGIELPGIKQPNDKNIFLKDILVDQADEKYYLSEKLIEFFQTNHIKNKADGNGFRFQTTFGNKKSKTITDPGKMIMQSNYIKAINKSIKNEKSTCLDASYYKGFGIRCGKCRQVVKTDRQGTISANQKKSRCLSVGGNGCGNHSDMDCLMIFNCNKPIQLNDKKETNNNSQPYQQNRIYSPLGKCPCLDSDSRKNILDVRIRRLTPLECERLQTVPDGYTNHVSDSQRYKMLGNGFTVDVIAYILKHIIK